MNKTVLKTFATTARKELLKKVEAKAMKIGITRDTIKKADLESSDAIFIDGKQLSQVEKVQRNHLIARIKEIGFNQVMEEVAYTWFNRFTALRYMEVNNYLPTKVRVLSSTDVDRTEPDMMKEALNLDLDLDKELVYDLKLNNKTDDLFKYLIIQHCNDLNRFLPFMFETIDHYTQLLFPDGLLATDSFIRHMTDTEVIPENNWNQIEVIGWLYQYYIAEEKDRVIKAKKRYKTEEIPFATQLFTPEWIVRYMVQNSLGRYWIESHPEHSDLLDKWEYFLKSSSVEVDLEEKLAPYLNKELKVEDIKCFDPAMGSGHILVYMFDLLYEIYSKCGYMEREIPRLIIEKNLYGLDIDDRAYQLASFSVMMKALEYNKRFLRSVEREGIKLNLVSIQETNNLTDEDIAYLAGESIGDKFDNMKKFIEQFHDAKTIGSLIKVETFDSSFIQNRIQHIQNNLPSDLFEHEMRDKILGFIKKILHQATIMNQKYEVLITNPPYAGSKYLTTGASNYLANHYPDVKSDLFSAFIKYSFFAVKENGQIGLITPFVWMFLSSYEAIRKEIVTKKNISSLIQLEYNSFEAAMVPVCTFTLRNYHTNIRGEFIQLSNFTGIENQPIKTIEAIQDPAVSYRYSFDQENFSKIPGNPIAYWVSNNMQEVFENNKSLYSYTTSASQNVTGNNRKYLRFHWEVNNNNIGKEKKWIFYAKGGGFRKWYGNLLDVVDWSFEAREVYRTGHASQIIPEAYWYKKGITWGLISSSLPSFRILPEGSTFDKGGSSIFVNDPSLYNYILGFLNSKLSLELMKCLNVTLNFQVRDVRNLPLIIENRDQINELVEKVVDLSKEDWDTYETSYDFITHPFISLKEDKTNLREIFSLWEKNSNKRNKEIILIENKINQIFYEKYNIVNNNSEIIEVNEEETVNSADKERDVKTFISYIVGCLVGRYSLDEKGLIYAGGNFDLSRYKTIKANKDNILPILPSAYFEDDIVSRVIEFIQVTFGEEMLTENLDFIADGLGRKKRETTKETIRRYFLNDFFKDHVQIYKKRPIYWLFTSGKQKAFNCLVYMHRYDKTTLSRIRTDYLHEYQLRLDAEKKDLFNIIEGDFSTKEISNAKKELKALDKKIEELKKYDELLHHMADMHIDINLDDGIIVNYEKFKGLVAKI